MWADYDGLSSEDLQNLSFLIKADKKAIQEWLKIINEDDIDYANLLIMMYHYRLIDAVSEKNEPLKAAEILARF